MYHATTFASAAPVFYFPLLCEDSPLIMYTENNAVANTNYLPRLEVKKMFKSTEVAPECLRMIMGRMGSHHARTR